MECNLLVPQVAKYIKLNGDLSSLSFTKITRRLGMYLYAIVGVVSSKDKRNLQPSAECLVEHKTGLECGDEREP